MIELTAHDMDYRELVESLGTPSGITDSQHYVGDLYKKHVGPSETGRACRCSSALCDSRKACGNPGACCLLNISEHRTAKCIKCDMPCGVLRGLMEVLG